MALVVWLLGYAIVDSLICARRENRKQSQTCTTTNIADWWKNEPFKLHFEYLLMNLKIWRNESGYT